MTKEPYILQPFICVSLKHKPAVPIGAVMRFNRTEDFGDWMLADGRRLAIYDYVKLFELIGHQYNLVPVTETRWQRFIRWVKGQPQPMTPDDLGTFRLPNLLPVRYI